MSDETRPPRKPATSEGGNPRSVSASGERFLDDAMREDVGLDDEGLRGPTGNAEVSADNRLLSQDLAYKNAPPDLTARVYEAQMRRGRASSAPSKGSPVPGIDEPHGDVLGSALPSQEGHRGRPSRERGA